MKRVLVIGSNGLLGSAIVQALKSKHDVIEASRSSKSHPVDISNVESLRTLLKSVGQVDSIICTAGVANFHDFNSATDADWNFGLSNKLMGQVNVVRLGAEHVAQQGSIILTTGVLSNHPMQGSSIVTTVNAAVDGFVKSAALELKDKVRVNAVSPGWVSEYVALMNSEKTGLIQVAAKG
jgi:NAD(P)-dependent dehydrogenase (short-subunit alcohol dehydrogenase family)